MLRPAHDALTGLPGPDALVRLLAAAGSDAQLVLVDVDGSHERNRRHGHEHGDGMLRAAAAALVAALPAVGGGSVLRIAGDEFAVVVPGPTADGPAATGRTLLAALTGAMDGLSACAGAVGVLPDGSGGADAWRTVRDAGLALQAARRRGPGEVAAGPDAAAPLASAEEEDLEVRTALRTGGYELHFQPLVEPATGHPVGVEALLRWHSRSGEVVGPGLFLPQVRRSGFIVELGTAILADALTRWADGLRAVLQGVAGQRPPFLAVNVDGEQVAQPGFDDLVLHLARRSGVDPSELVLEVTEAVLDDPATRTRLERLRSAGVRVAIDDFGAGPVVLSGIGALPVDILKVDQVLVGRLDPAEPDMTLITDLHRLAGLLGLELAVEAVETASLAGRIAALGVALAQGYHYARPMPPAELSRWIGGLPGAATPGTGGTTASRHRTMET